MKTILKHPSAWLPLAMSGAILIMILFALTLGGNVHHKDEGTLAHIFQLWLVIEFFSLVFFAVKWLPENPQAATKVLGLQIGAALIPIVIVFALNL